MIIVDVEATGVDERLCSLLSVGAVEFENPANSFYEECRAFPGAHIEKEALQISGFTLEEITTPDPSCPPKADPSSGGEKEGRKAPLSAKQTDREVVLAFLDWMKTCKEWTLAGQNPSFDRDFLQETAHRYHINWPLAHRTIDLHSVAYYHMRIRGIEPPSKNNHSGLNLDRILKYVGLPTRAKKHNALEDAKLETEAFSRLFYSRALFEEYKQFQIPERMQNHIFI